MSLDSYDVVVIGGGLAGSCVAYYLTGSGARTLLVDRHDHGRATDAAAGILSPETNKNESQAWDRLVRACGDLYPELVGELEAAGAGDTGYGRCGLLMLALADWDVAAYESAAALILDRHGAWGRPEPDALLEIGPDEARSLYPPLGQVTRALYSRDAARVDGRLINTAVNLGATSRGLERRTGPPRLETAGDRVEAVHVGHERMPCGAVVIAGGAWSEEFGAALGARVPVGPQRGQIVHLAVPGAETGTWPIVQPILGMYQVPWPGGRVAVGATVEPEAGFDARPTAGGMRLVFSEILRVAPGLADAGFTEIRVGLRPVSADDLPVLGAVPGWGNVHLATGYGANGLLLSPHCGRLVAEGVLGSPDAGAMGPFGADRFLP